MLNGDDAEFLIYWAEYQQYYLCWQKVAVSFKVPKKPSPYSFPNYTTVNNM